MRKESEIETMKESSELWMLEIESLVGESGTKALSRILGISEEEAADRMLECGARAEDSDWQTLQIIGKVLELPIRSAARAEGKAHTTFDQKYPTVIQWAEEHIKTIALIRAGSSFYYVAFGIVIAGEDAGRKRATQVIVLNRMTD